MPKRVEGGAITKSGKKIISLYITPSFEEEIRRRAATLHLTRQAYIITLINADLALQKAVRFREE